jgi:hypothetical protein
MILYINRARSAIAVYTREIMFAHAGRKSRRRCLLQFIAKKLNKVRLCAMLIDARPLDFGGCNASLAPPAPSNLAMSA